MSTVDNRIVNMVFDNKQFQQGIQQSTNSLEKFDQALNQFTNSGNALGALSNSVGQIADRFTWLGDLGFRAMGRIKEAILDVVETGVKQLNAIVNPFAEFSSGFDEYELKMGSIQTIMAGTGESLQTVNKYLDELNTYSDKTIYSFADMTQNIGKFTNAGVKLKDAVAAIQGVANLAAVSGANANEASHAMYNFAQALSAGHVKLIDWKSIENANMATVEFKNYLLEAGVAAGTLTKQADGMFSIVGGGKNAPVISATKEFNESLKEGWLTTQVLVDTLGDYSDEMTEVGKKSFAAAQDVKTFSQLMNTLREAIQSGWAKSFELIFGDFEEAKSLWTAISQSVGATIEATGDARNAMLEEWKGAGGRTALINGIAIAYNGLAAALGTVKTAFRNVFPPMTGTALAEWTKGFESFMKMVTPSEKTLSQLSRIFHGLFNAVSLIIKPFSFAYEVVKKFLGLFADFSSENGIINWLLEMTASIGDYITSLNEAFASNNLFAKGLAAVDQFIIAAQKSMTQFVDFLKTNPIIQGLVDGLTNGIKMVMEAVSKLAKSIVDTFCKLLGIQSPSTVFYDYGMFIIEGLVNGIKNSLSFVGGALTALAVAIKEGFITAFEKTGNFFSELGSIIATSFTASLNSVRNTMANFAHSISAIDFSPIDTIKEKFASLTAEGTILGSIGKAFTAFINMLKPVFTWLKATFGPMIDFMIEKLKSLTLVDIGSFLSGLGTALAGGGLFKFFYGLNTAMNSFSKVLEGFNGIGKAFTNILDGVGGSLEAFQGRIKAGTLMTIAKAVGLLAIALIALSFIPWNNMLRGIAGISVLMAELTAAMVGLNFAFGKFGTNVGKMSVLIGLGAAVLLLAFALRTLANINQEGLSAALMSMTAIIGLVVLFMRLSGAANMNATMFQLIGLGLAMKMFASALVSMSGLSLEQAAVGIGAFMTALAALGAFLLIMSSNQISSMGTTLIGIAIGLYLLGKAIKSVGSMDFPVMLQGISGLVITLLAMAAILEKFPAIGAVKLTSLAGAMLILSLPIGILGNMDWDTLVFGIAAIGATLFVIGKALQQFPSAQIPGLIGLAFALTLLMIPMAAFGQMDVVTIAKALIAVGGALIVIGAGLKGFPTSQIPGLIGLAFAMNLLIPPMIVFGMMDIMTIAKGLIGVGGALVVIAMGLKAFSTSGMDMIKTAAGLGILAAALTLLAVPIVVLGWMPWSVIFGGLLTIAGALAIIGVAMKFMPNLATMTDLSNGLLKIAMALAAISAVIIIVGLFDLGVIVKGILALAGAVFALTTILSVMPTNLNVIAKNLLMLAAAVGVLSGIVMVMGKMMNAEEVFVGLLTLASTLSILAIALMTFPNQATMVGFAIGIAAMAAGLLVLIAPLYLLSQMNIGDIVVGLIALAGTLVIIGVASALIGAGALAMLAFGAALVLVGGGLFLTVLAIEKLISLFVMVIKGFSDMSSAITEGAYNIGASIVEGFVSGMMSFVNMIMDAVNWICDKIIGGFKSLFGIKSPSTVFMGIGGNIMAGLDKGINGPESKKVLDSMGNFGGEMITSLEDSMDPSKLTGSMDKFMNNGMLKGLKEGEKDAQSLASAFGPGLVDTASDSMDPTKLMESTKALFSDQNGMGAALKGGEIDMNKIMFGLGGGLEQAAAGSMDPAMFKQLGLNVTGEQGIAGGMKEGASEVAPAVQNVGDTILKTTKDSIDNNDYREIGKGIIESLMVGMTEGQAELAAFLTQFGTNLHMMLTVSLENIKIKDVTFNMIAGPVSLLAGVEEGKAALYTSFNDIGQTLYDKLTVQIDPLRYRILGFNAIADNGLLGGLLEAKAIIPAAMIDIGSMLYDAVKIAFNSAPYEILGYNIVAGLVRGIQSGEIALLTYIRVMAQNAINAAKQVLDVHSPSGVFEDIGKEVDNGFAKGVGDNLNVVTDATSSLGTAATESMKNSLSQVAMADMDMDVNPVITPVLDLSSVQSDAKGIPSMLNKSIDGSKVSVASTSSTLKRYSETPVVNQQTAASASQTGDINVNNTYNVRNESDARRMSRQMGISLTRYQMAKGAIVK